MRSIEPQGFAARLAGAAGLGALAALFAATIAGWFLAWAARAGTGPFAMAGYRTWLAEGGWLRLPLWGAALGAWVVAMRLHGGRLATALALGAALAGLGAWVRTADLPGGPETAAPRTAREKSRAVLRWSYHTPATVARIVDLSRDPNPAVREQAVLGLGANLIVDDVEHATVTRPPRYTASPVRGLVRARLEQCLTDPVESIRAEAARALWKAPLTFGPHPAAAETLAAILDRAADPGRLERLAWIALDAAAGARDARLIAAAGRFASLTPDTQLARVARLAVEDHP